MNRRSPSMSIAEAIKNMVGRDAWNHLPLELHHMVMRVLERARGLRAILSMRLVSKSWHAAFKDYPGAAMCTINEHSDLSEMCGIMPAMSQLEIRVEGQQLELGHLQACTNLRSLSITCMNRGYQGYEKLIICLDSITNTVESLELWGVRMQALPSQGSALTKLALHSACNTPREFWKMIVGLPQIKVSLVCRQSFQADHDDLQNLLSTVSIAVPSNR